MTNERFFDMKAREAGFDLDNSYEREFCEKLCSLVWNVIHGEIVLDGVHIIADDKSIYEKPFFYYEEEECFILYELAFSDSLQVAYLLNQFGIELMYRNGDYRVYIKK